MNYNIVIQLADKLSNSPLEEERICELQPIEGLMDYYQQPFLGFSDPRNQKEYVVKWKDEKDRINDITKMNISSFERNLINSGHYFAMTNSDAQISKYGAISEHSNGISYLKNLKDLN